MELQDDIPEGYWDTAVHSPFFDARTRTWGVTDQYPKPITDPLIIGLDRSVAYAIAFLLNGDADLAVRIMPRMRGLKQYPRAAPWVLKDTPDQRA